VVFPPPPTHSPPVKWILKLRDFSVLQILLVFLKLCFWFSITIKYITRFTDKSPYIVQVTATHSVSKVLAESSVSVFTDDWFLLNLVAITHRRVKKIFPALLFMVDSCLLELMSFSISTFVFLWVLWTGQRFNLGDTIRLTSFSGACLLPSFFLLQPSIFTWHTHTYTVPIPQSDRWEFSSLRLRADPLSNNNEQFIACSWFWDE